MYLLCALNRSLSALAVLQRARRSRGSPEAPISPGVGLTSAEEPEPRGHRSLSPTLCVNSDLILSVLTSEMEQYSSPVKPLCAGSHQILWISFGFSRKNKARTQRPWCPSLFSVPV
ncbi:hypothetical protein EYF80_027577 [Liparis tanakae]|uniref:Uncharacterized protein n=1 Tax=Liparis tanakae TaxID=230148 RepID=A0A4Z2H8F6_9TELE|nr:hypothetical protein EYF80_027577 [Liparis tanakae]